ncbi:MAG TPA: sugar phosphate isomerase/epimerase [Streptosporangiaceae bacterium]|jgi:sugar phosphate isomerase/epimerase
MTAHPRLSVNQATTKNWTLEQAVRGCAAAGVTGIGLWRDRVAQVGAERAAAMAADAGLTVTSLCRGGFFTAPTAGGRKEAIEENRRAIDEAAALGPTELVLVVGGLPDGSRDLAGARAMVTEALSDLVPYARAAGVRLALEPMHPMFCADRGVLSTLGQAVDMAAQFAPDEVGVCVDTYHVWWDPGLPAQLARCADRLALFQVADWVVPLAPDVLLSRGHLGDGCADIAGLSSAVHQHGYDGWVEVEIFRREIWEAPGEVTLARVISSFDRLVAPTVPAAPPVPRRAGR